MFLMNAPPVVALQSPWEAFGPPRSFHFPDCLPESKEEAARASVSARVQMIISTLQRDGAALGMSHERVTQRGQHVERCQDTRLAPNPALCKPQPEFPACGLSADPDPLGKDEPGKLGPLELDSDSDDSVDRDIEEAIQEYLRAKGGASEPMSQGPPCAPEPAHSSTLPDLCPPQLTPGSSVGVSKDQGSASPASVSSEDSFEQSIRAEIEQFLNEKRQHENPKCDGSVGKKSDPSEGSARLKGSRETPTRAPPPQALMGTCKEFVFRKPPRLAKMNSQPRSLRPKVTAEPEAQVSTRLATPRLEAAQNRSGVRRSVAVRRSRRSRSSTPVRQSSDSSSDDGIEEAIQLYQLEKTRKETSGDPLLRAQLKEESPGSAQPSALPEAHRRPPSKKKPAAPKVDSTLGVLHPDPLPKLPKDAKASFLPGHTAARSETVHKASCRADTSTELMCAEAILDISKTILPAPEEGSGRPLSASPLSCPPAVPLGSDGDSSAVDSDDSIEKEIRMFLALKAQVGSPQPAQGPLSPPGPSGQTCIPKTPLSKTLDLPQGSKRKRRGGGSAAVPKKTKEVREGTQDGDHSQGKGQPSNDGQDPLGLSKASEVPGAEAETKSQTAPSRPGGLGDSHVAQGSEGHGKVGEGKNLGEKDSSEDKSSSLDSDEDLDMAIKDLLRSKRKLKKRCRDPRAAWKKKVRFGATETRVRERLDTLPRDWKDPGPQVLRSCLSGCRRDSPGRGLQSVGSTVAERGKPGGPGDEDSAPAPLPNKRSPERPVLPKDTGASSRPPLASTPLSEDSSVDSDDSIELEIRRFLAEKAKESVRSSEAQGGGPAALEQGSPAKPEMLCRKEPAPAPQPRVCTRSQRARGAPQLAEGRRCPEKAGAQAASLLSQPGRATPRAKHATRPPTIPALPRNVGGNSSAKASPSSRKSVSVHKDQGPRGAEAATAQSAFAPLPSCAKAGAEPGGATGGTFHLNCGSQNFLSPSSGPQADLTLLWSDFAHQSRLPSPWALNSGQGTAWTGVFGGEKEKGATSQAGAQPSLSSGPKKGLPFPGFSPLLSTQLFHFGKSVSWGDKQAGLFSPNLGLPLQGPAFSTFRETQPGHSPVFGSPHLVMKDSEHWQSWKAQGRLRQHHRRGPGPEDNILDLTYQHRGDQDQEALGSDASEFSDTSMEDGGSHTVKGKVLKL